MFAFDLIPPALLTVLLVVANVLGAAMAAPQAVRLVRTKSTAGVSSVWVGVSIAMNLWWLVYGVATSLWALVPISVVAVALYVVIAVTLIRLRRGHTSVEVLLGSMIGLVPLPALAIGGWDAAGVAIGVGYGLQLAPAVIAAYRTRELHGVAPGTWIMAWIESAIWFVYGLVVIDPALLVGGASGVVFPTLLLIRLVVTGHRPFRRPAWAVRPTWSLT